MDILKFALFTGAGMALVYAFKNKKQSGVQAYSIPEHARLIGGDVNLADTGYSSIYDKNTLSFSNPYKSLNTDSLFEILPLPPITPAMPDKNDPVNIFLPDSGKTETYKIEPARFNNMTQWKAPPQATQYLSLIASTERGNGIPRNLLARLLYQESRYRPEIINGTIKSPVGALGIAQVMPATANSPGYGVLKLNNPLNPQEAIPWAGKYLKAMYMAAGRSWPMALAAYNAGLGTVNRQVKRLGKEWLTGMPLETRNYVAQIGNDIPAIYAASV